MHLQQTTLLVLVPVKSQGSWQSWQKREYILLNQGRKEKKEKKKVTELCYADWNTDRNDHICVEKFPFESHAPSSNMGFVI